MRDPDALHHFYEYTDNVHDVIKLDTLPPFEMPDYDLNDEKEMRKYLFDIERTVRNSYEYRYKWLKYLREYVDMNQCSFYKNVSNIDSSKIKIEIHHDPLSLFDIVTTVFNKRLACHESLEVELVAKEVMYHHFAMSIGVIPLAETVHELVHNHYLFIPTSKVFGNYRKFVDEYGPYMPQDCIDNLKKIEEYTEAYDADEYKQLLQVKFIYVDATGAYDLPKLEDIGKLMKEKIKELMNADTNPLNPQNQ